MTSHIGIDWSDFLRLAYTNPQTGIRYGVIQQREVLQAWADRSEAWYGDESETECKCGKVHYGQIDSEVECECGEIFDIEMDENAEALRYYIEDNEYFAECGERGDIYVMRSPYYTYAHLCSPRAPGVCYLMNPLDKPNECNKAYCFGHDWFEDVEAPYPVYSVATGELVPAKQSK